MSEENETIVLTQARLPSVWLETAAYASILALFYASAVSGNIWILTALTAMFMFWNYRLFETIRKHVRYYNASEFSILLHKLAAYESNKHKDGTFQDTTCLTKEGDDEETTLQ